MVPEKDRKERFELASMGMPYKVYHNAKLGGYYTELIDKDNMLRT